MKCLSVFFVLMVSLVFVVMGLFFLLCNIDFVVMLVFLLFIVILVYYWVLQIVGGLLDKCVEGICNDLVEVCCLCEEVQEIYVSYECCQCEVKGQVDEIVVNVKCEVIIEVEKVKMVLQFFIECCLKVVEEQIVSVEFDVVCVVCDCVICIVVFVVFEIFGQQVIVE